jgi:Domain of unknown function (DUF4468) with TBP-like fold
MKNILIVITFILFSVQSFAQENKNFPIPFEFKLIDSVEGSQATMFSKAMEWMANTYKSSKSVIEFSDKESGKIVGKAIIFCDGKSSLGMTPCENATISYTITITVRDGKYKCEIVDLYHKGCDAGKYITQSAYSLNKTESKYNAWNNEGMTQKNFDKLKELATNKTNALLLDLKIFMSKSTVKSNDGF